MALLEWTEERMFLRAKVPEGIWTLGPERGGCADVKFRLAFPEGWDLMRVLEESKKTDDPFDPTYWRNASMMSGNDVGHVLNREIGVSLLDYIRRNDAADVEAMLVEGGFDFRHEIGKPDHPARIYGKSVKKVGYFTVVLATNYIDIDFERPRQTHWHNVTRFATQHDGAAFGGSVPFFIPFENYKAGVVQWLLEVAMPWIIENHKTLK